MQTAVQRISSGERLQLLQLMVRPLRVRGRVTVRVTARVRVRVRG